MKRKVNQETVVKLIRPLLSAGDILSNIAYNIKQRHDAPPDMKKSCEIYQIQWDKVRDNLPKWIYGRKN